MIKRERTLAELNIITHQLSLLDSITAKIDGVQFLTPSSGVDSEKATRLIEEDFLALDSRKPSSVSKQRHLEDTFLGREISFPRNRSSQESDVGNASLLKNSTRSTAKLVESLTTFPPRMLSSHDAWYRTPHQHKKVQEESIESILLAAASDLNMSPDIPKNDVDEYHPSVDAAQVRATSLEGRNCQGRMSIPLPSRSPMLSQCSDREKGIQEAETAEDSKPPAESEDDAE